MIEDFIDAVIDGVWEPMMGFLVYDRKHPALALTLVTTTLIAVIVAAIVFTGN